MKIFLLIGGASVFSVAAAASLATIHSMSHDLEEVEFVQPSVPQFYGAAPMQAEPPTVSNERPVEMPVASVVPEPVITPGGESAFAETEAWTQIDQSASLEEDRTGPEDLLARPTEMSFAAQPKIVAAPPVIRQQTTPRPVESLIPVDRPSDDRTVKQTWSVGVYR